MREKNPEKLLADCYVKKPGRKAMLKKEMEKTERWWSAASSAADR